MALEVVKRFKAIPTLEERLTCGGSKLADKFSVV